MSTQIEVLKSDAQTWALEKVAFVAEDEKRSEARAKEGYESAVLEHTARVNDLNAKIAAEKAKGFWRRDRRLLENLETTLFYIEIYPPRYHWSSCGPGERLRAKKLAAAISAHVGPSILLGVDDYDFLTERTAP